MNDKEVVRVAGVIQDVLRQLRRSRYMRCMAQLSLFAGTMQELVRNSRKLSAALSRDWYAAAERSCKNISAQLSDISFPVSNIQSLLDRCHEEIPKLSEIADELWTLREEFGDVEFNGEENALCVITEPITLEDIYLGRFRIALYVDCLCELYQKAPYFVMATDPHPAGTDDAVTHPHVSHNVVCEGDGAAAIRAALEEGRLCDFFCLVRSILTTYNPASPYVSLSDWHGIACYECGYVMTGEDSYYCISCENAICDSCSFGCADCGEVACKSCAGMCEICERSLCSSCAKTLCGACESVCCESCLDEGLCMNCKDERESDEEQETESTEEASEKRETTVAGSQLANGGQRACADCSTVQPHGVGQTPVLPRQVAQ